MVAVVKQFSTSTAGANQLPPLEDFTVGLFRISRAIRAIPYRWGQLPGGLKRSDLHVLRTLSEHGECRPGFIAEKLGVGPSVISRQLVALDEEQLILRRRDPEDGRAELIGLTDSGLERLATLRAAYMAHLQELFSDWDEENVLAAAHLLHEISDRIAPETGCEPTHPADTTNQKETA